jgi:hypothetical protein
MFKACPSCGFLVALIAGREASQRCPRCGSGLLDEAAVQPDDVDPVPARNPSERPRPPLEGTMPAHAVEASDDAPARPAAAGAIQPADGGTDVGEASGAAHAAAEAVGEPADAAAAHDPGTPSFATNRPLTRRSVPASRRWPWAVALPALALLLALQLLLSQRMELAQDARWRPLLTRTCGLLGCDVPAWREPRAFAMLARNVRPDGARPGVLHVSTSLRNDARWAQPLPVVVLSLSDLDGRVLAARAVTPREYGRMPTLLVRPGDSIDIAFDVREPSPRVVSFDFQLR